MARPSNEFVLAWSSLTSADAEPGWQAIDLPSAGPLQLRAGRRSPDNSEAVLVGFPSDRLAAADKLPEGHGFTVERADPYGDGRLWLALTRKSAGRLELFEAMVCDVIGALDDSFAAGSDERKLLRAFVGRVAAWQEFMRKGAQTLSPEAEIGLFGELMVLQSILESGVAPSTALEGWVGPIEGLQDFTLGTGAIEVKATLSTKGFPARIGSLEQLDDSTRQPLFVAGFVCAKAKPAQACLLWWMLCGRCSTATLNRPGSQASGCSRQATTTCTPRTTSGGSLSWKPA